MVVLRRRAFPVMRSHNPHVRMSGRAADAPIGHPSSGIPRSIRLRRNNLQSASTWYIALAIPNLHALTHANLSAMRYWRNSTSVDPARSCMAGSEIAATLRMCRFRTRAVCGHTPIPVPCTTEPMHPGQETPDRHPFSTVITSSSAVLPSHLSLSRSNTICFTSDYVNGHTSPL